MEWHFKNLSSGQLLQDTFSSDGDTNWKYKNNYLKLITDCKTLKSIFHGAIYHDKTFWNTELRPENWPGHT